MSFLPDRDLASEAAAHFQGTPAERFELALRLGREAVRLFLATQPAGTSEAAARDVLRRRKNTGRRPSKVLDGR
jgi:hypothetical protein